MKYIIFIVAFLFLSPAAALASDSPIMIGPVQASGATADDEFIVLINPDDASIDIGAWSIQYKSASGSTFYKKNFVRGAIIPPTGTYVVCGKDFSGTCDMKHSSFSLSSSGGTVFLVSNQTLLTSGDSAAIIDQKTYDAETTAAQNPNPTSTTTETTPSSPLPLLGQERGTLKIVINEFMPAPTDGAEWIELYNPTGYAIDLAGWTLADGTGKNFITLDGLILPAQFKNIDLAAAHLNNTGDLITLRDANKNEIDAVAYGDWDNNTANALVGEAGVSVARVGDGVDSNRDNYDFALTSTPTTGAANIITPVATEAVQKLTTKSQGKSQELNSKNQADLQWLADLLGSKNSDLAALLKSNNVIIINNLYLGDVPPDTIKAATIATKKTATSTAAKTTPKATTKTATIKTTATRSANTVEGQIIAPVGLTGKDMTVVRETDRSVEVRVPKDLKTAPIAGDLVSASGAWSAAKTLVMPRLLTKTFSIIGHTDPPAPITIALSEIDKHEGEIISIAGTLVEKQPTRFRLADGDQSILIKTAFFGNKNDKVTASGLLVKSGSDYLLTPLGPEALTVITPPVPVAQSTAKKTLPYAIAIIPAGILAGTIYIGKRIKKKKIVGTA